MTFNHRIFLENITTLPGIYQMIGNNDVVLYVGKASNLRKRLSSYFRKTGLSPKNKSLISQVIDIKVITTNSETEALILENNLIKDLSPKYNILLRDDKTYPYIQLTYEKYPRIKFYRGKKTTKGKFFGPFPSSGAVKETLDIMQKVFLIRNCDNIFFKNRSRPCLQYQIKRCTAPCVDIVSEKQYKSQIDNAISFLEGKNDSLIDKVAKKMQQSSEKLDFEMAAFYRDQLQNLRKILEKQYITNKLGDADIVAVVESKLGLVIQVFYYRNGNGLGSQSFFPKVNFVDKGEILQAYLEQIYFDKKPPKELILNNEIINEQLLLNFFEEKFNIKVKIITNPRQHRAKWLELTVKNAELALQNKRISKITLDEQYSSLVSELKILSKPNLIACVDISHTMGEETVGSYVVFDKNGPKKSDYRKYNINGITAGDDYAAIEQVLTRRFKRLKSGDVKDGERFPDILFIDGGKGQFNVAKKVLKSLEVDNVIVIGIAKGVERKAGKEILIIDDININLDSHSPASHLIQQIRDESHRFAITGHRKKRDKKRVESELKSIDGVGDKRRQSLLKYFAGIKGVKSASIDELIKVEGISPKMAKLIYTYFHGE